MTTNNQHARPAGQVMPGCALVVAARSVLASGHACRVTDEHGGVCVKAVDGRSQADLEGFVREARGEARMVLTGPRAQALGLSVPATACVAIRLPGATAVEALRALSDGAGGRSAKPLPAGAAIEPAREAERAGIELVKRAGLLPAILARACEDDHEAELEVSAAEIFAQRAREIESLLPVVETRLPIEASEHARLVVFRSTAGGSDQVALLIGRPETAEAPLCRLHSECLTGDLFGSLRCDCGEQLDGAIKLMAEEGAGVLLYLRQEGRGIGLVNKLRAYGLQDQGMDTVEANTHLGFQPDERDFAIAARMLQRLGVERIRLLTNNPDKMEAVARHGITIDERIPLSFAANRHNRFYLETKARKSGHLLRVIGGRRVEGRDTVARLLGSVPGVEAGP